jgi:hypothetical protein
MLCATSLMGTIERSELYETLANRALMLPVVTRRGETLKPCSVATTAGQGLKRGRRVTLVSHKGFVCWT